MYYILCYTISTSTFEILYRHLYLRYTKTTEIMNQNEDTSQKLETLNKTILQVLEELKKMNQFLHNIENKPLRVRMGPK